MRNQMLAGLLLLVAACSEPRKFPQVGETIPNLPIPPSSQLLSREGGDDALKLRFRSADPPENVAIYYRNVLSKAPWNLVSDNTQPDGTITLYAEQEGPPLWVSIRKADGATGSYVDLAGAKVKKPVGQAPPADGQ